VASEAIRTPKIPGEKMTDDAMMREGVQACLDELNANRAIERVFGRDGKLWADDEAAAAKARARLGWLFVVDRMQEHQRRLVTMARNVERMGRDRAVVVGMGGSSLWPELVGRHLGGHRGLRLRVLDSPHPAAIAETMKWAAGGDPLFVIASKSGSTIETRALYRVLRARWDDGKRFVAVTDPGTELATLAREEEFFEVFENPSDIGGRYAATSFFGLVPAVLAGVVIRDAMARVDEMLRACREPDADRNPGAQLGAFLAAAHRAGRTHLRLAIGRDVIGFSAWVEQLVAESTGKAGKGLLPVPGTFEVGDGRALQHSAVAGLSTFDAPFDMFVAECEAFDAPAEATVMPTAVDLWSEAVRWQMATALCCHLIGVNAFDEPDVDASKRATLARLSGAEGAPELGVVQRCRKLKAVPGLLAEELRDARPDEYIAVLAWLAPTGPERQRVAALRGRLQTRTAAAVTVQFGPRYLHSTGQLHKAGPAKGRFVVVHDLDAGHEDAAIPGRDYTCLELVRTQMQGDIAALRGLGRPVTVISVG